MTQRAVRQHEHCGLYQKKKNTIFLTPLYVTCCDAEKTMISSAERRRLYLKSAKTQNRETWERTGT
jgi:hypothetical protein